MTARYAAGRMRARDGRNAGWGVYQPGGGPVRLAIGYTGPLDWWRARWSAASLNRRTP